MAKKKKNVETFSYTLPPNINKRWSSFAKRLGHNRSTAFALMIPKIIDAYDETEKVYNMNAYQEIVHTNESAYYRTKSGNLYVSIHIAMDIENIT